MLGWFSAATARASVSNRRKRSASRAIPLGRTLIATSRPSRVSRARYTSPMPPAPSGVRISYGPILVPAVSAIRVRHYSPSDEWVRADVGKPLFPRVKIELPHVYDSTQENRHRYHRRLPLQRSRPSDEVSRVRPRSGQVPHQSRQRQHWTQRRLEFPHHD